MKKYTGNIVCHGRGINKVQLEATNVPTAEHTDF